jgi:hypothetical protein
MANRQHRERNRLIHHVDRFAHPRHNRFVLRRVLLAALMCVVAWASGHPSGAAAAPSVRGVTNDAATDSAGHATHLRPLDGHAGDPARSTDVWQSSGALVVVHTWRLDGHHAEIPAVAPAHGSGVDRAASPASRRSPPAPPHTFDLPLLI